MKILLLALLLLLVLIILSIKASFKYYDFGAPTTTEMNKFYNEWHSLLNGNVSGNISK